MERMDYVYAFGRGAAGLFAGIIATPINGFVGAKGLARDAAELWREKNQPLRWWNVLLAPLGYFFGFVAGMFLMPFWLTTDRATAGHITEIAGTNGSHAAFAYLHAMPNKTNYNRNDLVFVSMTAVIVLGTIATLMGGFFLDGSWELAFTPIMEMGVNLENARQFVAAAFAMMVSTGIFAGFCDWAAQNGMQKWQEWSQSQYHQVDTPHKQSDGIPVAMPLPSPMDVANDDNVPITNQQIYNYLHTNLDPEVGNKMLLRADPVNTGFYYLVAQNQEYSDAPKLLQCFFMDDSADVYVLFQNQFTWVGVVQVDDTARTGTYLNVFGAAKNRTPTIQKADIPADLLKSPIKTKQVEQEPKTPARNVVASPAVGTTPSGIKVTPGPKYTNCPTRTQANFGSPVTPAFMPASSDNRITASSSPGTPVRPRNGSRRDSS